MAKGKATSELNIAIIHPDLGIGGAERLIVDAAVELASHGHKVHIFAAHHDKNRCFEETISGTFPVTVLNFLSINRFERKKNIELAISAFAMLHSPEASLTIAGGFDIRLKENVEYLEELKALAEREGVSNRIRFITSCSTTERNALLSECLCVIYTPKDEHFGIVPVEAMAAYKPVIACNSGGPLESVKNDETGFLCDPIPEEFSSAMAKFIKDPKEAERMGREARKHVVDSFSTHTFGQSLNRYIVDIHRGKED